LTILQIEKINDVENESVIDVDNSASPGVPDVDDEFNTDKSHLYFVNINGLETTKSMYLSILNLNLLPTSIDLSISLTISMKQSY